MLKLPPQKWSLHSPDLWTPQMIERFERWKEQNLEIKQSAHTTFHFSSGHETRLLVIRANSFPEEKAYFLHRTLREAFAPALSRWLEDSNFQGPELQLQVSLLEAPLQSRLIDAVAFLSQTCSWKPLAFRKSIEKQKAKPQKNSVSTLWIHSSLKSNTVEEITKDSSALGQANTLVRTLADLPANLLNPKNYRDIAVSFAKKQRLKTEFLSTHHLEKLGAHAFLAVTRAQEVCDAGILKITYRPSGIKKMKKLALVGKGICFDTGGYNIKTGGSMHGMHGDMTGSALALAMVLYFAKMKAPFEVTAHLALAENLISPTAFKPNEIVTACDGTTIEVIDTDAEGRMILSDALALVRRESPHLVIDFATLTGAAIRALDTRIGAVFSQKEALAQIAVQEGRKCGERTWSFPLDSDYREGLKSEIADLQQCATHNKSDHIYAASFLAHFVGEETPWLHLDLTPAHNTGGLGLISSSTTGFGTRWTRAVVQQILS